jgi:hypothetical protein
METGPASPDERWNQNRERRCSPVLVKQHYEKREQNNGECCSNPLNRFASRERLEWLLPFCHGH